MSDFDKSGTDLPETSGKWPNFAENHSEENKTKVFSGAFSQILDINSNQQTPLINQYPIKTKPGKK